MPWASCHALGADDWVVVAQQRDEPALAFTQRVGRRARRLLKEDAQIDAVDVYAGPAEDRPSSAARREAIAELSDQIAHGGRLTLWSASADAHGNAEIVAMLAQFGPLLARRQIVMNHQACGADERSGVRHAAPTPSTASNACDLELSESCPAQSLSLLPE